MRQAFAPGRQGWLAKALAEYKLEWGVPGIFGWYASGDDGNVRNGSERLPSIAGAGNFTSFIRDGPYLTTNDGLLEFNLVNQWQVYENLELNLELGYIVNMLDQDTWQKSGYYGGKGNGSFEKQDAWKAQLTFAYSF